MSAGWLLVNIVAPFCLPIFGMLPLKLLPLTSVAPAGSLRIMTTVKDGQLCWAVVGMSAAALYEVWDAHAQMRTTPWWTGTVYTVVVIAMLPATMLAAGGAVFTTTLLTVPHQDGLRGWVGHYKVFVSSLIASLVSGLCYSLLHIAARPN